VQRSQWRAYRKLPSLFLMVPSLTLYDLPFPQNVGSICPQHTRMAISLQRTIRSTSRFVLGWGFGDGGSNGAISSSNKSKMAAAAILEKFQMAISPQRLTIYLYSAHRAVIFAIAQLSCSTGRGTRQGCNISPTKFNLQCESKKIPPKGS